MPCNHPVEAFRSPDGVLHFNTRLPNTQFPCGRCMGCRLDRAQAWAVRCVHEASLHENNCFVTLTYNNEHLPKRGRLEYRDFQLFMKRLRKQFNCFDVTLWQWLPRYYMAGEYGSQEETERPHFHACLFGVDFPDKYKWRTNHQGDQLYRSPMLETIWTQGTSEIGTVTIQSAGYVARYVLKKITGKKANEHYQRTDPATGETYSLPPEFNRMSLKPGIGAQWFQRYQTDVYNAARTYLIHDAKKMKPPRYYETLLERTDPDVADAAKASRQQFALRQAAQNTAPRRAAREKIQEAQLQQLKRTLKERT
jgi:hypothetical protein